MARPIKDLAPPSYIEPRTANDQVAGRAEIAAHYKIAPDTLDAWREHPLSPRPRGMINKRNPWWLLDDWRVFVATRRWNKETHD